MSCLLVDVCWVLVAVCWLLLFGVVIVDVVGMTKRNILGMGGMGGALSILRRGLNSQCVSTKNAASADAVF